MESSETVEAEFAFKLLNDIFPRSDKYSTDEVLGIHSVGQLMKF